MELKLTHETICINEVVFDGALEQAVELDYLLPDYCRSIFKVLKCRVVPKITSQRIQNGKLMIDGVAQIKVLYAGEEDYQIRCISQKQIFSKSVDLKEEYKSGMITAFVKCDYVNCRAVNQHRLDIRGALSIKAKVSVTKELEILSKASGMGIQVCNKSVTALDKRITAAKEFSINEELETAYGKPSIKEILDSNCSAVMIDCKIIANKVIIKGEVMLHLLYCPSGEGGAADGGPQIMDFTIPVSQVLDMAGINEEYRCAAFIDVTTIELSPIQGFSEGEATRLQVELSLRISCEASKNAQARLISDIYSTEYMVNSAVSHLKVEQFLDVIQENHICKAAVSIPQGELSCVYDIFCDYISEGCRCESNCILLSGKLCVCVLAMGNDNMPVLIEKSSPVEMRINLSRSCESIVFSPTITISSVSYHMLSGNEIEVCAELNACGSLSETRCYDVLTSISVDETEKKECRENVALSLYFAAEGEQIWDIAKRFNTRVEAVMLQNKLEGETLSAKGMLLIPITR